MTFWIDAQLPPALAQWLRSLGAESAVHVCDLGLLDAEDFEIFRRARQANAVLLTKDFDFIHLVRQHGPPPQVVWITAGNVSNRSLQQIVSSGWPSVRNLLESGEVVVELPRSDSPRPVR